MADSNNKLPYFFLGLGVGLAAGLLFAPKAGSETRALLREKADEGRDYLRRRADQARESATDFVERGKDAISRQREQFTSAMEAGRQAYREARTSYAPEEEGV